MDVVRTEFLQAKRRRNIVLATVSGIAVIAALGALFSVRPVAASAARSDLIIETVKEGEFVRHVRGPGVLVPKEIRWIAAQVPGRVERLNLMPGAAVDADSIIVELSNPELEHAVREAVSAQAEGEAEMAAVRLELKGKVLDMESQLAQARAAYESARLQAEAEALALRDNAVSQLQARRSRVEAEMLGTRAHVEEDRLANVRSFTEAQLRAQSARLEQLTAAVQRQRMQLKALQVAADMEGVVQTVAVQVGQQITAGTQIARIAKPGTLVAALRIPELLAKDVAAGQLAKIDTRNGFISGRVARVDPAVENGAVRVEVDLIGPLPAGTRPDLSVDGTIELERAPRRTFVARPTYADPETRANVFKLEPGGSRAHRVPVSFGKASVNEIEVLTGLAPGDRIIISDVSQWNARDELRIR